MRKLAGIFSLDPSAFNHFGATLVQLALRPEAQPAFPRPWERGPFERTVSQAFGRRPTCGSVC